MGGRGGVKTMGGHLTNRGVNNYDKDCTIVKPHKSAEVIRNHRLSLERMGDLKGPDGVAPQGDFPIFPGDQVIF